MKKKIFSSVFILLLILSFLCSLAYLQKKGADKQFAKLSQEIVKDSYENDSLSTHFAFQNPAEFGVDDSVIQLPCYDRTDYMAEADEAKRLLSLLASMETSKLSDEAKETYEILLNVMENRVAGSGYPYFEEPLSPTSGIHSSLPVLLAEYAMDNKEDVEGYLKLLEQIPAYFESLAAYEADKAAAGMFMAAEDVDMVISQCDFMASESGGRLFAACFAGQMKNVYKLGSDEFSYYQSAQKRIYDTLVAPAYEKLGDALYTLKNAEKEQRGLCQYEQGRNYYEYRIRTLIGTNKSCSEIEEILINRTADLYLQLAALRNEYDKSLSVSAQSSFTQPETQTDTQDNNQTEAQAKTQTEIQTEPQDETHSEPQTETDSETQTETDSETQTETDSETQTETDSKTQTETQSRTQAEIQSEAQTETQLETQNETQTDTSDINSYLPALEQEMKADFPALPKTSLVTIKQIPQALLPYTAPAYYFIPRIRMCRPGQIDDIENTIYYSTDACNDPVSLFTTLAHEGFPGHMYQNIYFIASHGVSPANMLRYSLDFPGYSEGWAMYIELLAYEKAASFTNTDELYCKMLRLSREIQLCVLCYLDIRVHANGATAADIAPFLANIGVKEADTVYEVYSYLINEPGTYLKYYVGYLELLECKELFQKRCEAAGKDYSELAFHTFFLEHGPDSYTRIREKIAGMNFDQF